MVDLDYSIYPQYAFSMQFFSRGCIRKCPFCLVRDKEGYIHSVEPSNLNPNGKHIEVLDNNFFANPEWRSAVEWLNATKLPVNLHGVDVRIMNEELKQLEQDLVEVFKKHSIEFLEGSLVLKTKPCYRRGDNLIVQPFEITLDRVLSCPKRRIDGTYEDIWV